MPSATTGTTPVTIPAITENTLNIHVLITVGVPLGSGVIAFEGYWLVFWQSPCPKAWPTNPNAAKSKGMRLRSVRFIEVKVYELWGCKNRASEDPNFALMCTKQSHIRSLDTNSQCYRELKDRVKGRSNIERAPLRRQTWSSCARSPKAG